jgi:5'-nucleotidase
VLDSVTSLPFIRTLLGRTGAAATPSPGGAQHAGSGIIGPPGTDPALVRIVAYNDLHGQLADSDAQVGATQIGGAATLAGYIERERAGNPNGTIVVSAGDAIGAAPPESTLLDHESTMAVMTAMGTSLSTFGNHEFDRGYAELRRLVSGGRRRTARSGKAGPAWPGSPFPWVSANVVHRDSGKPVAPPYVIRTINGARVAFIGAVTGNLRELTMASGIRNLRVLDPAAAINRYIPELRAKGVRAIVAVIHEGGELKPGTQQLTGDIVPIVKRLHPEVDVVLSAHTHKEYAARVNGKLVTQASSYGKALASIDMVVDRKSGDVISSNARIVRNDERGVTPDPVVAGMVERFRARVAPLTGKVVSILPGTVTRAPSRAGESALGTLIAEAQRSFADADFAFMNPGGIRQDITRSRAVTWGDLFTVQPFGNLVMRMEMTGAHIMTVLEQMFAREGSPAMLQVAGMRVWIDMTRPVGKRITRVITDAGAPLDMRRTYSVAVNSFLAEGGDGFPGFKLGRKRTEVGTDLEALVRYLESGKPVPTRPLGRLTLAAGSLPPIDD